MGHEDCHETMGNKLLMVVVIAMVVLADWLVVALGWNAIGLRKRLSCFFPFQTI